MLPISARDQELAPSRGRKLTQATGSTRLSADYESIAAACPSHRYEYWHYSEVFLCLARETNEEYKM